MGTLKLTWYDDLKLESDLKRMAIVATKITIPFSKLDLKESQVNGARLNDAIVNHKVEDYMQGYRNGDTFPRPAVHKTPTGYVILSGNQRCEALRRLIAEGDLPKTVEIEVYLIDTKDKLLLEIVARSANVAHGEGTTKEERIQHAMYCVQRLGMAVTDAAKAFECAETTVNQHIQAEKMRTKLQKAGVNAHRMTNAALVPLAKLDYDESAQVKIGTLAAQHNATGERIRQVATAVAKQTTPHGRLQKIREFEKELAAEAHASTNGHAHRETVEQSKVPLRPRRDKFISLLTRLVNFLETENAGEPFGSLAELQVTTQADIARVQDLAKRLRYRMGAAVK